MKHPIRRPLHTPHRYVLIYLDIVDQVIYTTPSVSILFTLTLNMTESLTSRRIIQLRPNIPQHHNAHLTAVKVVGEGVHDVDLGGEVLVFVEGVFAEGHYHWLDGAVCGWDGV